MQSKTLCFNPTLFRKNLTRFWPLWGGASLLGALAPLALLAMLMDANFQNSAIQPLEMTSMYYSVLSCMVPVVSLAYAILCALAVWHYLYNARSVSLLHSLPITRMGLFLTNFLSGMAMMLIPYAVTGFLAILVSLAAGCFEPVGILVTILGVAGDSFFYFASATLVIFITGNPFACAAFYFILHFFAAGAEYLVRLLMSDFYFGVETYYQGVVEFLSPTIYLMRQICSSVETTTVTTAGGWVDRGVYESVTLENGWLIGIYALAGLALAACAWLLYQRRRSESAGDVVAVGWMKPIFRYGVAFCSGIAGGLILYQIFFDWALDSGAGTASGLKMALCMALAGLVGYYIASMLLAKSLKVFRGSWKGALGTVIAAAALCGCIALDPAGIESWVPALEDLDAARITFHGSYSSGSSALLEDPAAIQKVLDLHQSIIDDRDLLDTDSGDYRWVDIHYFGENVSGERFYHIRCTPDTQSDALTLMERFVCDPVFQEENIFGRTSGSGIESARLTGGLVVQLYDTEKNDTVSRDLTLEEAQALEEAIHRDIQAGHFGRTTFLPDYEAYMKEVYEGTIILNYNITTNPETEGRRSYGISLNLTTSIHCTETLQALKDLGIMDDTHWFLTGSQFSEMMDSGSLDYSGGYPEYAYDSYGTGYEFAGEAF